MHAGTFKGVFMWKYVTRLACLLLILCAHPIRSEAQPALGDLIDVFVGNGTFSLLQFGNQVVGPEGNLYITGRNQIARYNPRSGVLDEDFIPPNSQ